MYSSSHFAKPRVAQRELLPFERAKDVPARNAIVAGSKPHNERGATIRRVAPLIVLGFE
jgi:hypothetical protein